MALDVNRTVSERHAAARSDESKLTAGQFATKLKKLGYQVTAKELAEFAPEWHHAGWNPRGGMGKCYFFPASYATDDALRNLLLSQVESARAERNRTRYGFKVGFRRYNGAYGKNRFQPIVDVREFAAGEKLGKYDEIDADTFSKLLPHLGADLQSYESLASAVKRLGGLG